MYVGSHLQCEVVLQARGDVQQRSAGLTRAEHELHMPRDGGRRRRHVVPLQQTVAQETLRAGHNYRGEKKQKKQIKCKEEEGVMQINAEE